MKQEPQGCENSNNPDMPPVTQSIQKKSNRPLLVILGIFIALVIIVFLTQKKVKINWFTDYDAAVQAARAQGKPLLLGFYRPNEPMVTDTFNNTYNDPKVKQFVEANFIPVLINVDEQPDLARKFNIDYYPTHYVKYPDSDKCFGPRLGWDPPNLFIKEMTKLLNRANESMQ
jgi:hypothetical protein